MWAVLTDYDHLADFVPNLDSCEKLPGGRPTRYRLRQHGCSQSLFWRLEAGAVLEVQARASACNPVCLQTHCLHIQVCIQAPDLLSAERGRHCTLVHTAARNSETRCKRGAWLCSCSTLGGDVVTARAMVYALLKERRSRRRCGVTWAGGSCVSARSRAISRCSSLKCAFSMLCFLGRPGSVCASADLLGVLAWLLTRV